MSDSKMSLIGSSSGQEYFPDFLPNEAIAADITQKDS